MSRFPAQYKVLIGSGSTSTSDWWFVGDFRLLTMSFASSASLGPSIFTVEGSNLDGFQSALPTATQGNPGASLVSRVNMVGVAPGMVTFDPPGYRWVRVAVPSANQSVASAATIIASGVRV